MKKLIAAALIAISLSNVAMANCDFSSGITKNADGSFTYTRDCHLKVGEMKRDLEVANTQIGEYKKVIDLKDLALVKANERADLWMNTSFKLQDRMNVIDDMKSKNQWLMFGLGVLTTGVAAYALNQTLRR
jgi:hypothetical protein